MNTPKYTEWLAGLAARDNGLLLVLVLVIIALAWLINARFVWQRILPLTRGTLLVFFYTGFAAVVLFMVSK